MIDYLNNSKILFDDNVLNIDTERYFREAEDYFFYFDRTDKALKLLKKAIKLTPHNVKCLKFIGDIYFATGKMKQAFDYYSQAAALRPCDSAILSSMAIVSDSLNKQENSLAFLNLAFEYLDEKEVKLYSQLCDFKFSLLVKMQKYKEAKQFLDSIKKHLTFEDEKSVASVNRDILKKKLSLKERMENLNIKVV
jgi:tetratricopeptide (TPR) repeat protein